MLTKIELPNYIFQLIEITIFMEFKCFFIELPNILTFHKLLQIFLQLRKLVILTGIVRQYRNTILQLENVGVRRIIHQHHAGQITINYSQIFGKDILMNLNAIFAIESMSNQLSIWINLIQHNIRITLMTGSKCNNLKMLGHSLQKTYGKWPNRNKCISCASIVYFNW